MGYLKSFRKVKREVKAKPGRKVSGHFEPLIDVLESQIDMFDEVIKLMQAKYQTDLIPPIFNNYLFFRLVFKDILSLIGQLQKEQAERDKNLTARSLALHLYEFLADAQDFLGPKMKGGLAGFDDLPNHDLLTKDLYKLKEIYKGVKDKTFKDLADIRNNTSAHKDQNPLLLRRKIRAISSHEVQVHAVLCTVLFLTIVHFQNNVMAAIMQEMDAKLGTSTAPAAPYKTVDRAFRGLVMIIGGTEPRLAEVLSDLTQEEIKKLVEVVAYLEKKDPMFPVSADKGVSARKPGLRRHMIDQIRKYWSKQ
jgi:hypothetical protein